MADQMARKYSTNVSQMTHQVFFNILDLAGISAWMLPKEMTGENISGQLYLLQLAVELNVDY